MKYVPAVKPRQVFLLNCTCINTGHLCLILTSYKLPVMNRARLGQFTARKTLQLASDSSWIPSVYKKQWLNPKWLILGHESCKSHFCLTVNSQELSCTRFPPPFCLVSSGLELTRNLFNFHNRMLTRAMISICISSLPTQHTTFKASWLDGTLAFEFEFAVSWRLWLRLECVLIRLGSGLGLVGLGLVVGFGLLKLT